MCPYPASRTIHFRVNEPMYMFLRDICETNGGIEMAELMRGIIQYFFMQFAMQHWRQPLPQIKEEFRDYLRNMKKHEKDNNEKIIQMLSLRSNNKKGTSKDNKK